MTDIRNLLLAVMKEAESGNEDCQKLLHHNWKSQEHMLKGLLILYTAYLLDEKMPHLFYTTADEVIELAETGKWDEALWQLYPTAMEALGG